MNQSEALEILKSGANVFLTGEPGSGKTHTVNEYVSYLRSHGIEPAITASTGIAATHIGGMTIHSWSGIGIKSRLMKGDLAGITGNDYVRKRVNAAKILIIDEISMLPPSTLEMIETIIREIRRSDKPFGGLQVVLVGDFFQLPPVVRNVQDEFAEPQLFEEIPARFAYDSPIWRQAEFVTCYLSDQYRQDDTEFLGLLTKIRHNAFDDESLKLISQRKVEIENIPKDAPKLYTHNVDVDSVNDAMLANIPGEARFFPMKTIGHKALVAAMQKGCLSPENLYLKVGAVVMFTKNNPKEGFVNGTLGTVEGFDDETERPIVRIRNGRKLEVAEADWIVEEDGKAKGTLTQIPLRLAWAITVHKSQGISLDEAIVDLSKVFEYGQGYVALSRVRRLSGIHLLGWNTKAFQVDSEVLSQDREFKKESASAEKLFGNFDPEELSKLQQDFLIACDGELEISDIIVKKTKKKVPTLDETLRIWNEGKSIVEIAKERDLSKGTIFSHILALVKQDKIQRSELKRVLSKKVLEDLPKIHAAFKQLKTEKLTPVFEHFQAKYSYDDLRVAKIIGHN